MSVTQLHLPHYSPYVTSHSRVYYDVWWWEDGFPSLFCSPRPALAANLWWTLSVLLPTASLALSAHLWIRECEDNKVRLIWSSAQCVFFGGGGTIVVDPIWRAPDLHPASNDGTWAVHCSTEWSMVLFQDLIWVSSGLLSSLLSDMWLCLWLRSGEHVPSFHMVCGLGERVWQNSAIGVGCVLCQRESLAGSETLTWLRETNLVVMHSCKRTRLLNSFAKKKDSL